MKICVIICDFMHNFRLKKLPRSVVRPHLKLNQRSSWTQLRSKIRLSETGHLSSGSLKSAGLPIRSLLPHSAILEILV